MESSFQIEALDPSPFDPPFEMDNAELSKLNVAKLRADRFPGYPCRVSLEDASVGEEVLLLTFTHLGHASPYKAEGPIFVRRRGGPVLLKVGQVPDFLRSRWLSLRGYDGQWMMKKAEIGEGRDLVNLIGSMLADSEIAIVHIHFAKPGCFACTVKRA